MEKCSICFHTEHRVKHKFCTKSRRPQCNHSKHPMQWRCQWHFAQMWHMLYFSQRLQGTPLGASWPCKFKSPREHRCFPTLKSCSFHFALQSWYLFKALGLPQSTLISPPQNSYGIGLHQLTINYEWFCDFGGITFKWATKQFLYCNVYSFIVRLTRKKQKYTKWVSPSFPPLFLFWCMSVCGCFLFFVFCFLCVCVFFSLNSHSPPFWDSPLKMRMQNPHLCGKRGSFFQLWRSQPPQGKKAMWYFNEYSSLLLWWTPWQQKS